MISSPRALLFSRSLKFAFKLFVLSLASATHPEWWTVLLVNDNNNLHTGCVILWRSVVFLCLVLSINSISRMVSLDSCLLLDGICLSCLFRFTICYARCRCPFLRQYYVYTIIFFLFVSDSTFFILLSGLLFDGVCP